MLEKFNHEFYLYCERKGIDPRDYLFDEMGIAIAGIGIVGYHWTNYKEEYKKPAEASKKDKLNADYEHKIETEAKKE